MVDVSCRELGMVPYTSLSHGMMPSDNTRRDKQNIMLFPGGAQRGTTGDMPEEIDVLILFSHSIVNKVIMDFFPAVIP